MRVIHIIIMMMLSIQMASAATVYCDNCTDCSAKIQNASMGDTVMLTEDIIDCNCTCIDFADADAITFDGGGHTIDGTRAIPSYGIYLPAYSCTNVIKNVTITDFWTGIYLFTSSYCDIQNVTAYNNRDTGITILYGRNNTLTDCSLQENSFSDFYFRPNVIEDCETTLINVTGSGDRPIGYYNTNATLEDIEFASLYLCNADGSTLENITIKGSDYKSNNALRMYFTDGGGLCNISSSDNFGGIFLTDSYNNTVTGAECSYSHQYGVYLDNSDHNTIDDVEAISNIQAGIYSIDSESNMLKGITTGLSFFGIVLDRSSDTTVTGSTITDNKVAGMNLKTGSGNNLIYDNYFSSYALNINFAGVDEQIAVWNITPTAGTNIIGGSMIGGNYWNTYPGEDNDGDGFGDVAYNVSGSSINIDYHPLVHPTAMCGDVDDNGYISANDVVETYRRAVDPMYPLPSEWAADVDGNGYISANDVVEIYRTAVDPNHPLNCKVRT